MSRSHLRYRLRGQDRDRFLAYERARRRVFRLAGRASTPISRNVPLDVLAGRLADRYGLDKTDLAVAITAATAKDLARR